MLISMNVMLVFSWLFFFIMLFSNSRSIYHGWLLTAKQKLGLLLAVIWVVATLYFLIR